VASSFGRSESPIPRPQGFGGPDDRIRRHGARMGRRRVRGMTLIEMAVAVLVLGIAIFLLAGLARTTRQEAKRRLAVRTIQALDEALTVYQHRYGGPPPGHADGASDEAIAALLSYGPSSAVLDGLPAVLRRITPKGKTLVDPWGMPFRYVTLSNNQIALRARVASNSGRPIFDSAGPDRVFEAPGAKVEGIDLWGEECLIERDLDTTSRPTSRPPSRRP